MFEYFRHAEHICFFLWRIIISVAPSDMEEFRMRVLASAFPFVSSSVSGAQVFGTSLKFIAVLRPGGPVTGEERRKEGKKKPKILNRRHCDYSNQGRGC
ncbi:hypothetical protein CGCF413_v002481 [Colletotrichum fructicola]|nr:hypothetical protein CGCF413_v002481 [Colletotrichum fructicola]